MDTVERIVGPGSRVDWHPARRATSSDSPVYNAGVEAEVTKNAAALLTDRMFEVFADAAQKHLPAGIPLYISGGCGLNCDWNSKWRDLGTSPPCSCRRARTTPGSALGTAIDALAAATGDPYIEWDVYSGLRVRVGQRAGPGAVDAAPAGQSRRGGRDRRGAGSSLGCRAAGRSGRARSGTVPCWPSRSSADAWRLNQIKQREGYRPIAPCCRIEDAGRLFDRDFEDPYMLYFRRVDVA